MPSRVVNVTGGRGGRTASGPVHSPGTPATPLVGYERPVEGRKRGLTSIRGLAGNVDPSAMDADPQGGETYAT
jgi:hypothetical protein